MSPGRGGTAAILAITATLALAMAIFSAAARATSIQPIDLSVDGGEESWHPSTNFAVRWRNPASAEGAVAAVRYRLLDPSGAVLKAGRIDWPATAIQPLAVEPVAGIYTAEIRLEDATGDVGPAVTAELRYDEIAPGDAGALPVSGWIGRASFPYRLRLGPAAAPLSGIRGWAVSIDQGPWSEPCADARLCTETETDLRIGAGDRLAVGELPEGTNYVRTVAVSGSGRRSASVRSTVLRVDKTDPVTRLSGDPAGWSSRPLTLTARASDEASGMAATGGPGGPFTAIRVDGGTPVVANGGEVTATVVESGVHTVTHYAQDAAGNVADGGSANGRPNRPPQAATVRIDRDPPRLSFLAAQDPDQPETIVARASDALSGVDGGRGRIAIRATGGGEPFDPLPTGLSGALLRARWDSETYPPGEYEFRATAYDRAGNETSTGDRVDGSPMRLRNPLKVTTKLVAGLERLPAQGLGHFGGGAWFSGRMTAGRRAPAAGMLVRVVERFDPGAEVAERSTEVRTAADGSFRLHLGPGPSRQVVALAPPTATLRAASSRTSRLLVRGSVRLRVSSAVAEVGGRPVVFAGRAAAAGAAIPPRGKLVELQFRLAGMPWSEFRTIRTDGQGRFRYAYRFADDDSRGARFRFRAFGPAQAGWPFEPAGSPPVTVSGR